MAGWGSNNKFSMLGAMRAIAQMVSYELPLIITVLPVVMVVGSLTPDAIVAAQGGYSLGIHPALVRLHALGRGRLHFVFCLRVWWNRTARRSMSRKANRKSSPAT